MPITLDVITRKKLILVRQIYQRAVLQAEAQHSYVDRILSLIGFDGNRQILLTNNLNAVADGVYIALTFFGAEQTAGPLVKPICKTARRWFKMPQCLNKQISGIDRSFYTEGNAGLTLHPDFYPDQDTHG